MTGHRTLWLGACFAAVLLLLSGIPYWRLPYNADFLADPLVLLGFGGLSVATAMLVYSGITRLAQSFWTMLAAFPAAVAIRVAVDVAKDPTDHNLWPFELIIGAVFSLVAVVPGLLVGLLLRRILR